MSEITHHSEVWAHRTPRKRLVMWLGWLALVALFVWCWQVMTENTIWAFVADAPCVPSLHLFQNFLRFVFWLGGWHCLQLRCRGSWSISCTRLRSAGDVGRARVRLRGGSVISSEPRMLLAKSASAPVLRAEFPVPVPPRA